MVGPISASYCTAQLRSGANGRPDRKVPRRPVRPAGARTRTPAPASAPLQRFLLILSLPSRGYGMHGSESWGVVACSPQPHRSLRGRRPPPFGRHPQRGWNGEGDHAARMVEFASKASAHPRGTPDRGSSRRTSRIARGSSKMQEGCPPRVVGSVPGSRRSGSAPDILAHGRQRMHLMCRRAAVGAGARAKLARGYPM